LYQVSPLHAEYIICIIYSMYDLITIGNVSIDMYYSGDSFTQKDGRFQLAVGGKYMADHFYSGLGGGAANVAIGIKQKGLSVAIMGKIGKNQFKAIIEKHLKDHDIPLSLCQIEEDYTKISSILLSPEGERTIINYETPHEHILRTDADLAHLDNTKAIYMSNLWRVPLDERKKILSHVFHKNILTAINLGIADCRRSIEQLEALLEHVKILIVNTHEFAESVKKPIEQIDFKKDIVHLFPSLASKIVVITDGEKGAYAYATGNVFYEAAPEVTKVRDTTGAGDGFSAGFLSGYLTKNDIQAALHEGAKRSAIIIQKIGAN